MPPQGKNGHREQKLVVVGGGGVGKSAITIRFVTSHFYDEGYNPTIEDSYKRQFVVDDEAVTLEILDTAGQEEFAAMADQWYTFGAGFLLLYSITDRPTFEALPNFHQEILRVKDKDYVPCVVVSNKCDLSRYRAVGQLEGREMARSLSAPFIECSAADGVNIEVAFRELVKLVRKDQKREALLNQSLVVGGIPHPHHNNNPYQQHQHQHQQQHQQQQTRQIPNSNSPYGQYQQQSHHHHHYQRHINEKDQRRKKNYSESNPDNCCLVM